MCGRKSNGDLVSKQETQLNHEIQCAHPPPEADYVELSELRTHREPNELGLQSVA